MKYSMSGTLHNFLTNKFQQKMRVTVFVIFKDTRKHLDNGVNAYTLYLKIESNLQHIHIHHVYTMALFRGQVVLFLHQIDDFFQLLVSIACKNQSTYNFICDTWILTGMLQ